MVPQGRGPRGRERQYYLGGMFSSGRGASQDYGEAVKWYRKAADQGQVGAMEELGRIYERGWGTAKSPAEAARWYRKAADQGIPLRSSTSTPSMTGSLLYASNNQLDDPACGQHAAG